MSRKTKAGATKADGSNRCDPVSEQGGSSSFRVDRQIERVPIDSVSIDAANVRRHPEKNLAAIKASLVKFGQQTPIIIDERGVVIVGNGRLSAAKQLGWTSIDVLRTSLNGAEAIAYAIADNRTSELAEWDEDALAQQLAALQSEDINLLTASGFDVSDVTSMQMPDFQPGTLNEQGRLDVKKPIQCPDCGHEFTP